MNLGKVDVPVELLTKDGELNEAERSAIRTSLSVSAELLKGGPAAQHAAKDLLEGLRQGHPFDDNLLEDTAQRIAAIRAGPPSNYRYP